MKPVHLLSPAKLNLYLRVINKRPDGYHNIKTVFERIDLFDEITLRTLSEKKIKIRCDHPHVPLGPKNLVHRAAALLQEDLGTRKGVQIHIKKRIPVAAGLAGGSSNAATVLAGLNRLWKLGLKKTELESYARRIGSDVAFFLNDCSWALGTERGDRIKRLDIKAKLWHVVVVPRLKIYSWKVYGGLKLRLTKRNDDVNILIHNLQKNNFFVLNRFLHNDLETVVLKLAPQLGHLKDRLKSLNAQGVMISGSGPAVFGLVETRSAALKIQKQIAKQYQQTFVVQTL